MKGNQMNNIRTLELNRSELRIIKFALSDYNWELDRKPEFKELAQLVKELREKIYG